MYRLLTLLTPALVLAGCSDPLAGLDSFSDVNATAGSVSAVAAPAETGSAGGFFANLLASAMPAQPGPAPVDDGPDGNASSGDGPAPDGPEATEAATADSGAQAAGGFWDFLTSATAATPVAASASDATTESARGGQVIPYGTQVPYGQIATVCDVPGNRLGTRIGAGAGYTVYDTFPNSTDPRPHYITGFTDGCVRQVTAALALVGDVGTHEVVRYLPSNRDMPYSGADTAYEAIKSAFCRVGYGQPCGARIDQLARRTTFITVYQNFGDNPNWADILLHDGEVAAMDYKGG